MQDEPKTENDRILYLNLCESESVFLKPDVLYRFEVDRTCERCVELEKIAND